MSLLPLILAAGEYHYRPFEMSLPQWWWYHRYLLLPPLLLGIAVVYKCIRCQSIKKVPRQALSLFIFLLAIILATAGALIALLKLLEL